MQPTTTTTRRKKCDKQKGLWENIINAPPWRLSARLRCNNVACSQVCNINLTLISAPQIYGVVFIWGALTSQDNVKAVVDLLLILWNTNSIEGGSNNNGKDAHSNRIRLNAIKPNKMYTDPYFVCLHPFLWNHSGVSNSMRTRWRPVERVSTNRTLNNIFPSCL